MGIVSGKTETGLSQRGGMLRALCLAVMAALSGAGQTCALAQVFPSRLVRIVVPYAPVAVASPERVAQLPNVPTTAELGYGEVGATVWWGIAAPVKTSAETVSRINEAVSRVLNNPETRRLIEARSLVVVDLGPKAFAEQLAREFRSRAEAVRRSGAMADQ